MSPQRLPVEECEECGGTGFRDSRDEFIDGVYVGDTSELCDCEGR